MHTTHECINAHLAVALIMMMEERVVVGFVKEIMQEKELQQSL